MFKELRKKNYDALLIHGYSSLGNHLGYLAALLAKTPIIISGEAYLRKNEPQWKKILKEIFFKIWFRRINAFMAIGTVSKNFYKHFGVPEEKIFLFPYPVDNEFLFEKSNELSKRKRELKKELKLETNKPIVLSVARLIKRKRPFDLLKAAQELKEKALFVFVGDGILYNKIEKEKKSKELNNVIIAGFKTPEEVYKYYTVSDIFVLPSSYEPWGFVINEAMCFGLPIVAADGVAAAYDLVHHRENGFIFESKNSKQLTKYLEKLVDDPSLRKKMGKRSNKIISRWNSKLATKNMVNALEFIRNNR